MRSQIHGTPSDFAIRGRAKLRDVSRATWQSLLDPRWQQSVFSVRSCEYDWIDVFLSAMIRGDWQSFEQRLIEELACHADAAAAEAWPTKERINEAAARFRYDRDLITAEEAQAWLDRHEITVDEWMDYLNRELLRTDLHEHMDTAVARHRDSLDLDTVFVPEGRCSGRFDEFAKVLAGRVAVIASSLPAVQAALKGCATTGGPPGDEDALQRVQSEHRAWLEALDPADVTPRLRHLTAIERLFAAEVAAAVTEEALAIEVARHRADWMRVHLERISFSSDDAAREAICSIREDGLTLRDVAVISRRPLQSPCELLERLEPNLREAVLSATVGEILGPIAADKTFDVAFVAGKVTADLHDPPIRMRAEQEVVDQLVSKAVLTEVRWIG